jgi:hypothetical protein
MPRKLRDAAAGLFHITCHAVWTSELFRDDVDRIEYLRGLAVAVVDFSWTCISYCLLGTHLHLILEVGDDTLPPGMQHLNTGFACRFNSRHRLRGHVFAGRYDARRLESDAHLVAAFKYDAWNPVGAGLCGSPEEWHASSYAATIGLTEMPSFVDPSRILRYFGGSREVAIARLRAYVEDR